jgi:hypothetical protein
MMLFAGRLIVNAHLGGLLLLAILRAKCLRCEICAVHSGNLKYGQPITVCTWHLATADHSDGRFAPDYSVHSTADSLILGE